MIIINKECVNPDLARNNNNICYLYIYLNSDTIITITGGLSYSSMLQNLSIMTGLSNNLAQL